MGEYPQEFFIKLGEHPYLVGRLTLNWINKKFNVEIDIVQIESKKIWSHVDILYGVDEKDECLERAVQRLSDYLKTKQTL